MPRTVLKVCDGWWQWWVVVVETYFRVQLKSRPSWTKLIFCFEHVTDLVFSIVIVLIEIYLIWLIDSLIDKVCNALWYFGFVEFVWVWIDEDSSVAMIVTIQKQWCNNWTPPMLVLANLSNGSLLSWDFRYTEICWDFKA